MTDMLKISGADLRLKSEILTSRDTVLNFKAPSSGTSFALYGPHIALADGFHRFELGLRVENYVDRQVWIELCINGAALKLYERYCFPWELAGGIVRVSYTFTKPVENFEMRLKVPATCSGCIKYVSIMAVN
jgi:hypothetical protein